MTASVKVSRLQREGQITIPLEIRQELGLEEGDLVAFEVTGQGVVIKPQTIVAEDELERVENALREQDFSFQEYVGTDKKIALRDIQEDEVPIDTDQSIAEMTYGMFEARKMPEDFKELRNLFIEGTAENVRSEAASSKE